jgi:hypothetical protein
MKHRFAGVSPRRTAEREMGGSFDSARKRGNVASGGDSGGVLIAIIGLIKSMIAKDLC